MTGECTDVIELQVPEPLLARLDAYASEHGLSRSEAVSEALGSAQARHGDHD